jgi:hypothetical protein
MNMLEKHKAAVAAINTERPESPDQQNPTTDAQTKSDTESGATGTDNTTDAANTADSDAFVPSTADAEPVKAVKRRLMPITEAEAEKRLAEGYVEAEVTPLVVYKHRTVRHFKVGEFEFVNHLLYLYSEEANENFLDSYANLLPRDQHDIVVYDHLAASRVETAVTNTVRGSIGTGSLRDPKAISG